MTMMRGRPMELNPTLLDSSPRTLESEFAACTDLSPGADVKETMHEAGLLWKESEKAFRAEMAGDAKAFDSNEAQLKEEMEIQTANTAEDDWGLNSIVSSVTLLLCCCFTRGK
mmetsp:Transcript_53721/g.100671  ORF Transcript_53721/g.100671 Transcript_53721/m.100671 type:complete len:113 (-) Transcript_53721:33-371(-)